MERTFYKKIQSRKAFIHRESLEAILNKAEDSLEKVRIHRTRIKGQNLTCHIFGLCFLCNKITPSPGHSFSSLLCSFYLILTFSWQCYKDYCNAYKKFATTKSQQHLADYYEAHNSYVQQLHATNGMLKLYQIEILPSLLEVSIRCTFFLISLLLKTKG